MDRPIDPQEQVVQKANSNTQSRVFNQSGVFVIGILAIVVLFIMGIGLYFFKIRSQSLTPGQSKRISETAVSKKEWHGIIATKKGFVKINADGQIENGADNQPAFFLPLGTEADYAKNFGNYTFGTATFKDLQLLPDGKLVFSGSAKQQSAAKENTIYSWLIDSKETPKALVQLPEGQKIQSFAFSPDSKSVAVIAVTRTSGTELYEGIDSKALSLQEQLKIYQQRVKDLQEQLRTISIYDISTTKAVNTIKLSSSTRDGTTQLIWRKQGLFAKDFDKIILFNPDTGKIITESPDNPNQSMVVSSDGSKFFDIRMLTLHDTLKNKTTGQMNIPELIAPEEFKQGMDAEQYFIFLGPATFSPDSKKIALEAGSVSLNNFRIWEQNFENGKTRKLVDLNTLGLDSTLGTKLRHYVPFMTYNPTGTKLVFALYGDNPDTYTGGGLIDVVSLDLTTLKEFRNDFFVEMNNLRELSFLGWYQAASTQSSTRPQTPGPPEAFSTANWKTYTNTNGYSFRYPVEVILGKSTLIPDEEINNVKEIYLTLQSSKRYNYNRPTAIIESLDPQLQENTVIIDKDDCTSISGKKSFTTLNQFAELLFTRESNPNCRTFHKVVDPLRKMPFNNLYEGYTFTIDSEGLGGTSGGSVVPRGNITYLLLENSKKFYLISYDSTENVFNQILSTFKFLDQSGKEMTTLPTESWETYSVPAFFTIKYPPGWKAKPPAGSCGYTFKPSNLDFHIEVCRRTSSSYQAAASRSTTTGKVIAQKEITIDNHPGIQVETESPDGTYKKSLFIGKFPYSTEVYDGSVEVYLETSNKSKLSEYNATFESMLSTLDFVN